MKKRFYTWRQFDIDCAKIANKLSKHKGVLKNIFGIPRGGLVLAVCLSHKMGLPIIYDKKLITKATLVVDDISDSGKTMFETSKLSGYKKFITATLFLKPDSIYTPTYYCRKKDDWVVFPWEEEATSKYDKTNF